MEGTAAIVVLALGTLKSFLLGIVYMLIFSLGSILGMAAMSFAISVPLKLTSRYMTWGYWHLNAAIGVSTIFIGSLII